MGYLQADYRCSSSCAICPESLNSRSPIQTHPASEGEGRDTPSLGHPSDLHNKHKTQWRTLALSFIHYIIHSLYISFIHYINHSLHISFIIYFIHYIFHSFITSTIHYIFHSLYISFIHYIINLLNHSFNNVLYITSFIY